MNMRVRYSYGYILARAGAAEGCRLRVVARRGGRRGICVCEVECCRQCARRLRRELRRGRVCAEQAAYIAEDFLRECGCGCCGR